MKNINQKIATVASSLKIDSKVIELWNSYEDLDAARNEIKYPFCEFYCDETTADIITKNGRTSTYCHKEDNAIYSAYINADFKVDGKKLSITKDFSKEPEFI